jgi:hypothetical protein
MKTFIADIIPRIQKYSQKLDDLTLLINQHWVVVDEITNSKTVYIFRPSNELLISKNGKVEKAKWEYLGNNALLVDLKNESYLFRHGFFDENILALKIDGMDEYVFLVNETRFDKELNSVDRILEFLKRTYIAPQIKNQILEASHLEIEETAHGHLEDDPTLKIKERFKTNIGEIEVEHTPHYYPFIGDKAYLNGNSAPDGIYKLGFMWYLHIKDGKVLKISLFGKPS